jgi:hypothetical protein
LAWGPAFLVAEVDMRKKLAAVVLSGLLAFPGCMSTAVYKGLHDDFNWDKATAGAQRRQTAKLVAFMPLAALVDLPTLPFLGIGYVFYEGWCYFE